jgi:hypothetical protein
MQQIPLSQGQVALVDDADYPLLSEFRWCYRPERDSRQGYAVRNTNVGGKRRQCYLHRQLMRPGPGQEVIFLNHDRLDCRRENLRVVSKEDARRHHRVRRDTKSGVKGVRFNPANESWSAYVYRNGHAYHVGTYFSREQAVAAYEQALRRENPDLHAAPKAVERPGNPGPVRRENPDAACLTEGR